MAGLPFSCYLATRSSANTQKHNQSPVVTQPIWCNTFRKMCCPHYELKESKLLLTPVPQRRQVRCLLDVSTMPCVQSFMDDSAGGEVYYFCQGGDCFLLTNWKQTQGYPALNFMETACWSHVYFLLGELMSSAGTRGFGLQQINMKNALWCCLSLNNLYEMNSNCVTAHGNECKQPAEGSHFHSTVTWACVLLTGAEMSSKHKWLIRFAFVFLKPKLLKGGR